MFTGLQKSIRTTHDDKKKKVREQYEKNLICPLPQVELAGMRPPLPSLCGSSF